MFTTHNNSEHYYCSIIITVLQYYYYYYNDSCHGIMNSTFSASLICTVFCFFLLYRDVLVRYHPGHPLHPAREGVSHLGQHLRHQPTLNQLNRYFKGTVARAFFWN